MLFSVIPIAFIVGAATHSEHVYFIAVAVGIALVVGLRLSVLR